jgi:hypothetical protein
MPETLCPKCGHSPIPAGSEACPACGEPFSFLPMYQRAQRQRVDKRREADVDMEQTVFGGNLTGEVTAHPGPMAAVFFVGAVAWFLRVGGVVGELREPLWALRGAVAGPRGDGAGGGRLSAAARGVWRRRGQRALLEARAAGARGQGAGVRAAHGHGGPRGLHLREAGGWAVGGVRGGGGAPGVGQWGDGLRGGGLWAGVAVKALGHERPGPLPRQLL